MKPRLGAFEVSTVNEGNQAILFFSKQMSGMWPHAKALANRLNAYIEDRERMQPEALAVKYFTSGRRSRTTCINKKTSSMRRSSVASFESLSPTRSIGPDRNSQSAVDASPRRKKTPPKPKAKWLDQRFGDVSASRTFKDSQPVAAPEEKKAEPKPKPKYLIPQCSQGHKMEIIYYNPYESFDEDLNKIICGMCRRVFKEGDEYDGFWHCLECNAEFCNRCKSIKPIVEPKPAKKPATELAAK